VLGAAIASLASSAALLGLVRLLLPGSQQGRLWNNLMGFDAVWYEGIAKHGYHFNPLSSAQQNVNFFPLFPLLERAGHALTGLPIHLVAIGANVGFQALAAVTLALIVRGTGGSTRQAWLFVALLCLAPTAVYDIMGYYSAVFTLLLLLAVLAEASGRPWLAAAAIGCASAANPLGIAFAVALFVVGAIELVERREVDRAHLAGLVGRGALSVAGVAAFMVFLSIRFGDPLAFYQAAAAWSHPMPLGRELESVLTLTPVRDAITNWVRYPYGSNVSFLIDAFSTLAAIGIGLYLAAERRFWSSFVFWLLVASFLLVQLQSARATTEMGTTRYLLPVMLCLGASPRVRRLLSSPLATGVVLVVFLAGLAFFVERLATGQWVD
jgi:hypothetical protein